MRRKTPALTVINESKQTSGTIDGIAAYYTNAVAPVTFKLLTVNYYDNYTFPSSPVIAIPTSVEGQTALTAAQVKGLTTASWTRVLTSSTAMLGETNAIFYDAKARPIRNYLQNYLGGYTYTDSKLDPFSGQLQYRISRHKRTAADAELVTKDVFTYSDQDRLLTQTHQINGGTIELIASNTYDELGQLVSKKVGNTTALPTQNINYSYNIRGWLTGINDVSTLTKSGDPKDLFAFNINYNTTISGISGVNALYNGNIAETQWATNSDNGVLRTYGYKYDNLNRLKAGIYKKGTVLDMYNESLTYDKNGNIMSLIRNGNSESTATQIDNLTYSYGPSNLYNRLTKVVDSQSNTAGLLEEFKDNGLTTDDFDYDANGNMIKDNNKNITAISYNHLNLPTKITFGSAGNIVYIYNATGQKVQKIFTQGASITTTDYLGGYQYNNNILKFFPIAEGYVEPSGSSYKYVYQYKDHLGNIRLSYDKSLAIQEENNYYPFGLKQKGYNIATPSTSDALKRKYNGKELQDELGLNVYDYSARNYDPALGRWMNIDPLAEQMRRWSPYNYGLNNPVFFIDPDGMKPRAGQSGTYYDWDEGGYRTADGAEASYDEAVANHSGGAGIDPPSKKKVEDMTPAEKNEYWRKYNESTIPFAQNVLNFAFVADGAGALSELFAVKASFKMTSLSGLFAKLLSKEAEFTVASSKFEYFFGKVISGNKHNVERSAQNLADLTELGIKTEKDLMRVFNKAWKSPTIKVTETSHGVSVIKSASVGNSGQAIQVSFFYKGGDMGLTPTISSIIPKL